jgi:sarcosine oxidase gamma subunit
VTATEMADQLEQAANSGDIGYVGPDDAIRLAAAELRRSCATCQHFNIEALTPARCYAPDQWIVVPQDGRGYCRHKWAAKETE